MAYYYMRRSAVSVGRPFSYSENRLESGESVNMPTRWFAFVPPCIGRMAKNFRADLDLKK